MAAQLSQSDLKALEQTRQRLTQLHSQIASLMNDVMRTSPLPNWSSLEVSASILSRHLQSLSSHLAAHQELFQQIVVYPCTNYPGREQEGLLTQLLRKKVEPKVEDWIAEGRAESLDRNATQDLSQQWDWAQDWLGERVVTFVRDEQGQEYTAEEIAMGIENVNTGLKDQFESDDEDAMDEDGVTPKGELEITGVRKASAAAPVTFEMSQKNGTIEKHGKSMAEVLRFMTRGDTSTGPQQVPFRR